MKKILVMAALVIGIFAAQAEAYQPQYGDVAIVHFWHCEECDENYKQIVIEPHKYSDPNPPTYGCHSNKKIAHKWNRVYSNERYIFSNGQWRRA